MRKVEHHSRRFQFTTRNYSEYRVNEHGHEYIEAAQDNGGFYLYRADCHDWTCPVES